VTPFAHEHTRETQSWTSATDLQAVIGRDGRFHAINPAWTRLLGYASEEVVGHSVLEFVLREDVVFSRRGFDEVLSGIDLRTCENCVVRKNGELRWISWSARAAHDLVFLCGTDVTAAKIDATRQMSTSGLRSILQADSQYQALLTPEGVLFSANAVANFGAAVALADITGKPFWTAPWFAATPGMSAFVRNAVQSAAAGNMVQREIEIAIPPSSRRWLNFTLRPLRDDGGSIEALLHTAVDRTEHTLVESCLHQAQKMEAMGQLVGGIADSFANALRRVEAPLSVVLRLINEGQIGETREIADLVTNARASTRNASGIAQRLLDLSAAHPFAPRILDVADVVTTFMETMRDLVGHKIAIDIVCDEVWPVVADRNQFESALLDLCVNARDAMPDGGTIETKTVNLSFNSDVAATVGLSSGDYVCVSVADTGAGIAPETSSSVREPFFMTERTRQGTGLGLFMASNFVRQADGQIHMVSDMGRSTVVSLYLPRFVD
jgi:PAS domain S-box-containing protein